MFVIENERVSIIDLKSNNSKFSPICRLFI